MAQSCKPASSSLKNCLDRQWAVKSTGISAKKAQDPDVLLKKPKRKFAPMVPKKSALTAKIEAVIEEHDADGEKLRAKLDELERAVKEADEQHELRLSEKTKTLQENIKYYGSKTQELI